MTVLVVISKGFLSGISLLKILMTSGEAVYITLRTYLKITEGWEKIQMIWHLLDHFLYVKCSLETTVQIRQSSYHILLILFFLLFLLNKGLVKKKKRRKKERKSNIYSLLYSSFNIFYLIMHISNFSEFYILSHSSKGFHSKSLEL